MPQKDTKQPTAHKEVHAVGGDGVDVDVNDGGGEKGKNLCWDYHDQLGIHFKHWNSWISFAPLCI